MEWGILFIALLGVVLAFIVLQASLASRHWRKVIAGGDVNALREALDAAFEDWRRAKPPRDMPPADWRGLQSATLVAADRDRCRVSMLADADVRVIENRREQVGAPLVVARRVAISMAEHLLYEIPHVRFDELQIDVYTQDRTQDREPDGSPRQQCVLATRVTRAAAAVSDWDTAEPAEILSGWETREATSERSLDPDDGALIASERPGAVLAVEGGER